MTFPYFFVIFVLFLLISSILRYRATKHDKKQYKDFLDMESEANSKRSGDISHLDYISIPLSTLPISEDDPALKEYEDKVVSLSEKKLLNLNGMTNTEIKLEYGLSNLEYLSNCDDAFNDLCITLNAWGNKLHELGKDAECKRVLSYAVEIGSDIKSTYALLADLSFSSGDFSKIDYLIEKAQALNSIRKDGILNMLRSY